MSSATDIPFLTSLWEQSSQILMAKLTPQVFNMFLSRGNVFPLSVDEHSLTLGFPPNSYIDWMRDNYGKDIEQAVQTASGMALKISFQVLSEEEFESRSSQFVKTTAKAPEKLPGLPAAAPAVVPEKDHRLDSLNSNYTFDSFVVGPNTNFAYNACRQVAQTPGQSYNPLFIHGPSGLGKTHLMQAIAREVCRNNAKATVEYLTSERFGNLYIEACNKFRGNMVDFRRRFRKVDVLLIDDVQFFAGKAGMQEEFFHTFEELYNDHKQIVLASDRIPEELSGLSARLISRFAWGVTVDITLPDLSTRMAILNEKQQNSRIKLPSNIIEYLATRVRSNVRTLESCLRSLQAFISLSGDQEQPVTKALVDDLCGSHFDQDAALQLTVARVQEVVAHFFDVRVQEMRGKSRQAEITQARQVAMYLSRELTGKSLPTIAAAFEKTHPTVLHSIRTIERKVKESDEFRQTIADISRKLSGDNN